MLSLSRQLSHRLRCQHTEDDLAHHVRRLVFCMVRAYVHAMNVEEMETAWLSQKTTLYDSDGLRSPGLWNLKDMRATLPDGT